MAAVTIFGATLLLSTAISIGVTIASIAYQVIQAKKMKKAAADAAEARKGFEVVTSGDVQTIPIVYGRAKIGGTRVWHNTKSNHTAATSNADKVFDLGAPGIPDITYTYYDEQGNPVYQTSPGTPGGSLSASVEGSKNEFLYFQQVLCHGPINSVVDFVIDESRFSDDSSLSKGVAGFRSEIEYDSSAANSMILANFTDRKEAKFPGLAVASTAIRLNRDDPQFSSNVPMVQYFIEGRKVRTVINGVLQPTRVYSNNPAWCLLDYLLETNDRTFNGQPLFDTGRGLSVDDIDLNSFRLAANICSQIVASNKPVYGNVWQSTDKSRNVTLRSVPLYECNMIIDVSKPIRENVEALLSCMGDARLIWSGGKYKLSLQYPATNADIVVAAEITDNDLVHGSEIQLNWPSASERLNHAVVRFHNEAENFKEDMASWPPKSNGTFSKGVRGTRYPVSNSSAGDILSSYGVWSGNAEVTTLEWKYKAVVSGTHTFRLQIDDSGTIHVYNQYGTLLTTGSVSGWKNPLTWTADLVADEVYRIVIVGNDTGGERGVAATISKDNFLYWTTRDPAYAAYDVVNTSSSIYDTMRLEDNGIELETSVFLEGCTDYYHALAKAEELVRTSRTAIGVSFSYIVKDNFLEPGDIIKLQSSTLNIGDSDFYVRINQVKLQDGATCEVVGSRFDYTQLAWNVADDQYVVPPNVYGFGIPAPKDVVYTPAQANVPNSAGTLTWAGDIFDSFSTYVIYVNTASDFDADGRVLFREIGRTTSQFFNLPQVVANSAYFGVRAMSKSNRFSEMVLSSQLAVSLLDLYTAKMVNLSANTSVAFVKPRNGASYLPATLGFTVAPEGFTAPQIRWFIDDVLQATYSNQTTAAIPAFSDKASKFLKVRVFEGASDIFAEDTITLFSLQEGGDAYQLSLSNENIELAAFADGTYKNTSQFPILVTSVINRGSDVVTANSYSVAATGLTASVSASGVISITAISQPFANLTLNAIVGGQTLSKLLRVITIKDGQIGASVTEVSAYKRSASALEAPTGGSYNFETNVLTPPTGWSVAIPTGTEPVYLSKATAQGLTVDEVLTWSIPVIAFQNGAKGDDGTPALPVVLDISGLANFTRNAGGAYTPATKALTAVVVNLASPSFAWSAIGATLSNDTGITTTMTPNGSSDTITITLSVTSATLSTPLTVSRSVTVAYNGAPGQGGQNGVMSAFPTIYKWTTTATAPTRPATTSDYTWGTGSFTAPEGWSSIAPSDTTPGRYLWSVTVPLTVVATTVTSSLDWTNTAFAVRAIAYNGTNGDPGADGTNGISVYVATVYKQSTTAPETPVATASTFNFSTNVLTPPSGWSVSQPATTTTPTYACDFTFSGAPGTTVTGTGSWSTPYIEAIAGGKGDPGNNGEYRDVIQLYLTSATAPTKPTSIPYTFSNNTVGTQTGGTAGWTLSRPSATTTPTYVTTALAATTTPGTAIALSTWSDPVVAAQVGAPGSNGTSVYAATVYQQSASVPATPVATTSTFNFTTNVLTPPAGWSVSQPATTTTPTYACDYTFAGAPGSTATGTGNWSAPYIEAVAGAPGNNGEYRDVIQLYLTSATAPTKPTSIPYTFSSNTVGAQSGGTAGWSLTRPAATTTPTYVTTALAATTNPAAAITLTSWSDPVITAQVGTPGTNGTNGTNGANGAPGSATYLINRGATNSNAQPTDAEVIAAVGRSAQLGDIATINYNSGNASVAYRATSSGASATWSLQTSYITGSLIVQNTITGDRLVANAITADKIAANTITTDKLVAGAVTAVNAASFAQAIINPQPDDGAVFLAGPTLTVTTSGGTGSYLLVMLTGYVGVAGGNTAWTTVFNNQTISVDGSIVASASSLEMPVRYSAVGLRPGMTGTLTVSLIVRLTNLTAGTHTITTGFTALPANQNGQFIPSTNNWPASQFPYFVANQMRLIAMENKV